MLGKKYPELKKPIKCTQRMGILESIRDIQFHRNLAKVDERMLLKQWKEDGLEEGRAEGRVEGRAEGHKEGLVEGRVEGRVEGHKEGRTESRLEIAKNAITKGLTPELIQEITGLDLDTIQGLYKDSQR